MATWVKVTFLGMTLMFTICHCTVDDFEHDADSLRDIFRGQIPFLDPEYPVCLTTHHVITQQSAGTEGSHVTKVYVTSDWHCSVPSVSASSTLLDNIRLSPQTCTILTYLGWQSDRTVQFNPVSARTCSTFLGDFRGTSKAWLWITLWYRVHIQLLLLFCGSLFRLSKPT